MLAPGKKLTVFSMKNHPRGTTWIKAGTARVNRDGSLNIYLDVLPLDGKLHVREWFDRPGDQPPRGAAPEEQPPPPTDADAREAQGVAETQAESEGGKPPPDGIPF